MNKPNTIVLPLTPRPLTLSTAIENQQFKVFVAFVDCRIIKQAVRWSRVVISKKEIRELACSIPISTTGKNYAELTVLPDRISATG